MNHVQSQHVEASTDFLELWKAIHGGCWPGPQPDPRLSEVVREVLLGLDLYSQAAGFQNKQVAGQARKLAATSLHESLAKLQEHISGELR